MKKDHVFLIIFNASERLHTPAFFISAQTLPSAALMAHKATLDCVDSIQSTSLPPEMPTLHVSDDNSSTSDRTLLLLLLLFCSRNIGTIQAKREQ